MTDGNLEFVLGSRDGGEVQPPYTDMVWEVLLVDFGIISVGGGPCQVAGITDVECIAELVVQVDVDITQHTGWHRAFASTQLKVRWGSGFDRDGNVNKLSRWHVVGHAHNVGTNGVGQEDVRHNGAHAPVGGRVGDGFTRHCVSVLVDHVSRDGQRIVRRNRSAQRCDDEVRGCSCGHVDHLRATDQTETRVDAHRSDKIRCEQAVASDASG